MDDVEVGNVNAQFHRRRAEEHRKRARPEQLFACLALLLVHLARVFAALNPTQNGGRAAVELAKERVGLTLGGLETLHPAGADHVRWRGRAIAGEPEQRITPDLKRTRAALGHVHQNACPDQNVEQHREQRLVGRIAQRRRESRPRPWGAQEAPKLAAPREAARPRGQRLVAGHQEAGRRTQITRLLLGEGPRIFQRSPDALDQIGLALWVETRRINRQLAAHILQQRPNDRLALRGCRARQLGVLRPWRLVHAQRV